jgi:hypothetical protein
VEEGLEAGEAAELRDPGAHAAGARDADPLDPRHR